MCPQTEAKYRVRHDGEDGGATAALHRAVSRAKWGVSKSFACEAGHEEHRASPARIGPFAATAQLAIFG